MEPLGAWLRLRHRYIIPRYYAESVGHSAEDHRGSQRPLARVVGRLDVAARQEHQQLVARRHHNGRTQVAALDIGGLEVQQAIQRRRFNLKPWRSSRRNAAHPRCRSWWVVADA